MDHDEVMRRLRTNDTTLTTLDLWYNGLGEVGGAAVARALESNTTLTTLSLVGNHLGESSGVAVAGALERNTTLTALNLLLNRLGEVGGAAVAGVLERNTTLTTLYLEGNGVHDETMERVYLLLSGREVATGSEGVEIVSVKAAVAALPRGTKRGAPG